MAMEKEHSSVKETLKKAAGWAAVIAVGLLGLSIIA